MRTIVSLICFLFVVALVHGQTINVFRASFSITEIQTGITGNRTYTGTLYYADTWVASTRTGHETIRFDILLNDGTTTTTLKQMEIYQDQFFRYTTCTTCTWQDLFAQEPLPKLYIESGDSSIGSTTVNGIAVDIYEFDQTNVVGDVYTDFVTLYVRQASPRYPVRAVIRYSNGVTKTIDMSNWSQDVPESTWTVDSGCPVVDPSCFRLDLAIVVDISGSVGSGTADEKQFILNLIDAFLIGPRYIGMSLSTFSDCTTTRVRFNMKYDKTELRSEVNAISFTAGGWTCIVGGVQRGFWTFATVNGSRVATDKAMIVLTDGNGNVPCMTTNIITNPTAQCGPITSGMAPCCPNSCYDDDGCQYGSCCPLVHNEHLKRFYAAKYAEYRPRIYAVGVTNYISDQTLRLIVNDDNAINSGEPRIFRVESFADLNRIIAALASAVVCNVPGSETCPNDCRPGGFCCGGSCKCTQDCSLLGTECQLSVCQANRNGAGCVLGAPDNAACQDPSIQCQDRFCVANVGCRGTVNDNLTCTDNNACTIDFCSNGTCTAQRNESVSQCDDFNPCTEDDACLPDGSCVGTPNDNLPCDDGNLCTEDQCVGGQCVSAPKECTDEDITDCRIPFCNSTSGECDFAFIREGFQCLPSDSEDFCTVYVCEGVDPDAGENGNCVARTRDDSDCEDEEDNTPAIIGGVIGGVALLVIILVAAGILLAILLKTAAPGLLGTLNPFAASTNVTNAGTYVDPMGTGQSGLYEDPNDS